MATMTRKPQSQSDANLRALRAAAEDPTDPIHENAIAVLARRGELLERGWDSDAALDRALEEHRSHDETVGA